jgi:hypothetical protein
MKVHALFLLCACALGNALGQGGVEFSNRPRSGDALVTLFDGNGPGPLMNAGLYLVRDAGLELIYVMPFRSGLSPQPKVFGYADVMVPGVAVGASARFRVRAWDAKFPSYEAAVSSNSCCGEFQTTYGNYEIYIPALGDPNPHGTQPIILPKLEGLLPLEVPCLRAPTNANVLVPSLKLTARPSGPGPFSSTIRVEVSTSFPGQTTVVEASEDLVAWFPIRTHAAGVTTFEFVQESRLGDRPVRWYRALVRPN